MTSSPFCELRKVRAIVGLIIGIVSSFYATVGHAAAEWKDITSPLLDRLIGKGERPGWPGGCSGVVVNRLNGDVTVKVVGQGLWRSSDQGKTWRRIDKNTISGRDETGWATSVDQNEPVRMASFSLDGKAGWTTTDQVWKTFTDLGRNWDYGSVDWGSTHPMTIIAAKHETDPPGEVYATTDGGITWKQLSIHLNESRGQVSMIGVMDKKTFIYSTGKGIHRSSDLGATWTKVSTANPQTRIPVLFQQTQYLGTKSGLLISKDKGVSWQSQGSVVDIWQGPFFGQNEKEMMVVGKEGVFITKNAGEVWTHVADLKTKDQGFLFTVNWFGCYSWDPLNNILYASSMGNPVFKLELSP